MITHKYLLYTNLLLAISVVYFLINEDKPLFEYILAGFLVITIILSQLFWKNPIKGSKIHKIDAFFAKIVIFSFILYVLFFKFHISFLFILFFIALFFYFSNYYSTLEWISKKHVIFHGLLHIFCFLGTIYAFTPIAFSPIAFVSFL